MSDPHRLVEQSHSDPLGELVRSSVAEELAHEEALDRASRQGQGELLRVLFHRKEPKPDRPRLLLVAGGAAALAAAALLLFLSPFGAGREPAAPTDTEALATQPLDSPRELAIQGLGTFEQIPMRSLSVEELPSERRLRVDSGLLRAQVDPQSLARPLIVVTPHLRVIVLGTRFDLLVEAGWTRVELLQGRVRVESASGTITLLPGQAIRSDDPALAAPRDLEARATFDAPSDRTPLAPEQVLRPRPSRPARAAAKVELGSVATASAGEASVELLAGVRPKRALGARAQDCVEEATPEQANACLGTLAVGQGLTAQNALYLLALRLREDEARREEAIATFQELRQRFPTTIYASASALQLFELQLGLGKVGDAIATAEEFERRFPEDPRASEMRLARARLLCSASKTIGSALPLLRELAEGRDPRLKAEARELMTRCASTENTKRD